MLNHATKGLYKKLSTLMMASTITTSAALVPSVAHAEKYADDNYVYAGLELGLSEPIWKEFDYEDNEHRKTKIGLQDSKMLGGRLGWSFYPGMALEISGTHQPKHGITYVLPKTQSELFPGLEIPETPGKTKVKANVYTINLLYKLPSLEFATITPYVIGGAGIAIIDVKPTSSQLTLPPIAQMHLGKEKVDFFRIRRTKSTLPVYQAGIGFSKEFGKNFEIDFSSRFQIIQDVKINYDILSNPITNEYKKQKPIKKTIAVGEFTVGLLFKLPV